ncbi:MAG: precorrin-2 dehydrogenase/sirohydrochlorin ferrochelatase family protein [Planctomycetota bacterium]|jgi:precorrin-2 dehydrogenase/sirohydrochlorin ferrochelatase
MNPLYPLFLDLHDRKALVVGGGSVALRKIDGLLQCHAEVTVVALEIQPRLLGLEEEGRIRLHARPFEEADVEGMTLVIAATDDPEVNRRVYDATRRGHALCNVVDVPELCDFHVPAQVVRGDLKVAVSTGGKSPAFASRVRNEIEGILTGRYAEALRVLEAFREGLKKDASLSPAERREILLRAVSSDLMNRYLAGKSDALDPEKLR